MDKKTQIKFFGLLLCALVMIGGVLYLILAPDSQSAMAKPPQKEAQMLEMMNQARKEAGAPLLVWDAMAAKIAQEKVADMIKLNYFAHVSPKTGELDKQFEKWGKIKLGENAMAIGENLAQAQGYDDKELTPQFWHNGSMNSPEHRKNVINNQFTHVGIAIKRGSGGKVFMAQIFYTPMEDGGVQAPQASVPPALEEIPQSAPEQAEDSDYQE